MKGFLDTFYNIDTLRGTLISDQAYGNAWYATGAQARQAEPGGEVLAEGIPVSFDGTAQPVQAGRIRLFTGLRSDPFFADVEGALHGFVWTGHDDFADNNVDSIVLEVPADMLGGPAIGVWASISRHSNGVLDQLDRGGNPTINPFINPDGEKNLFNSRQPAVPRADPNGCVGPGWLGKKRRDAS